MTDQPEFTLKQIVWGKVSQYPWWPARVVKTLNERGRKIYRVHFFGDPTYCYLQSKQLREFQAGLAQQPQPNSIDSILKKSIDLAKTAYKKYKNQTAILQHQYSCSPDVQASTGDLFEQTKLQSKPLIENVEKILLPSDNTNIQKNETASIDQKTVNLSCFDTVCPDNVIQLINGEFYQTMKATKGYNNRKQVLNIEIQLKDILLTKYHLRHINKSYSEQKGKDNGLRIHRNVIKTVKNNKPITKKNGKKKDYLALSAKKLYGILKRSQLTHTPLSHTSITKIITNLQVHSQNNANKYAHLFLQLLHWVKQLTNTFSTCLSTSSQNQTQQFDIESYLLTKLNGTTQIQIDMEGEMEIEDDGQEEMKKEDEEKSKVTQIGACYSG